MAGRVRGVLWIGALLLLQARVADAGDANHDMEIDISDGIAILGHLFLGDAAPPCLDAADVDDSGAVDIGDAVHMFLFLFQAGVEPGDPYPTFELDPTPDTLGCLGPPVEIRGDLTADQTWTRDRVYELVGQVFVKAPAGPHDRGRDHDPGGFGRTGDPPRCRARSDAHRGRDGDAPGRLHLRQAVRREEARRLVRPHGRGARPGERSGRQDLRGWTGFADVGRPAAKPLSITTRAAG